MTKPIIILGPALMVYDGMTIESKTDISITITDSGETFSTSWRGRVAQKLLGRSAEIKFTPTKWTDHAKLFSLLSASVGSLVFGNTDKPCLIYGADGTCVEFARCAFTSLPSIGLGVKQDKLGEFTMLAQPDISKPLSEIAAIYKRAEKPVVTEPTLTAEDIATNPFIYVVGDPANGGFVVHLQEGATIDFDVQTTEIPIDLGGDTPYDYIFTSVQPTIKLKPLGITYDQWETLVGLKNSPRVGGVLNEAPSGVLRGLYKDDLSVDVKKAACLDRGLTYGIEDQRFPEITLTPMGDWGKNKITIGTCAADFVWPEAAPANAPVVASNETKSGTATGKSGKTGVVA